MNLAAFRWRMTCAQLAIEASGECDRADGTLALDAVRAVSVAGALPAGHVLHAVGHYAYRTLALEFEAENAELRAEIQRLRAAQRPRAPRLSKWNVGLSSKEKAS